MSDSSIVVAENVAELAVKTATFIREHVNGVGAVQRLYRLSVPMTAEHCDEPVSYEYVIVSAVVVDYGGGPETYIFGADENGDVVDWLELPGSYRGDLNHEEALRGAGYSIAERAS